MSALVSAPSACGAMTLQISRTFGLAAITAAAIAFCAQLYTALLPYRITFLQRKILDAAEATELVALAIAVVGGLVAVMTERGKNLNKLGLISIIIAFLVFFMCVYTDGAHSSLYC